MLRYDNPLVSRYASREMSFLFSPQKRHSLWRELWVALAQGQFELGVTGVSQVACDSFVCGEKLHAEWVMQTNGCRRKWRS